MAPRNSSTATLVFHFESNRSMMKGTTRGTSCAVIAKTMALVALLAARATSALPSAASSTPGIMPMQYLIGRDDR